MSAGPHLSTSSCQEASRLYWSRSRLFTSEHLGDLKHHIPQTPCPFFFRFQRKQYLLTNLLLVHVFLCRSVVSISVSVSVSLCLCVSVSLCLCFSVSPCLYPCLNLPVSFSLFLCLCTSDSVSLSLSLCLCLCLFLSASVSPSLPLCLCLFLCRCFGLFFSISVYLSDLISFFFSESLPPLLIST